MRISAAAASLPLLLTFACSHGVVRPDGGIGLLPVGSVAPEVVGADVNAQEVRLSSFKGKAAVVFFYPRDASPGCTKEVCGFRGAWKRFQDAGIGVIGVSSDSAKSHLEWLRKEQLPFALAADVSGDVAKSYGVPSTLGFESRVSFLVGADGKVAKVWPAVDPAIHFEEVLAAAAQGH